MGPRTGRQIPVAMSHGDERNFLAFLRDSADVRILVASADTEDELFCEDLSGQRGRFRRNPTHRQFFLWNTAFPWTPDIAQTAHGCYIREISRAPVVEYDRWTGSQIGRLYWAKSYDPAGTYEFGNGRFSYDAAEFNRWYEQIVSWVKSKSRVAGPPTYRRYYLPGAWFRGAGRAK